MRRWFLRTVVVATLVMLGMSWWRDASSPTRLVIAASSPVPSTTRDELQRTMQTLEQRLIAHPSDAAAVVQLAETLIRVQRVGSDASAVIAAEQRLRHFAEAYPGHYEVQRALGAVLLSQHRFSDAVREAQRARALDPRDAWNYGVLGDAHLELGDYDAAFAAFDRMGALRPGPPAYARVAYALELKGDLPGALESLQMAADGTSAHDAEGQAWHYAQLGNLLLQMGRLGDAARQYERAAMTFPDHPYATAGLARIQIAEGRLSAALATYQRLHRQAATPETAFVIGDLFARLQQPEQAEAMYQEGEQLERDGWKSEEPQPQALARFFAERNRNIAEAVRLAERAVTMRRDIHTMDSLAWAYFRAGRLADANAASTDALRTGTRDARIVLHAAEIRERLGDHEGARALRARASVPMPEFTLLQ